MRGYGCPYCGRTVDWVAVFEQLLLQVFEGHLDRHIERGDQLLEQPLSAAS